MRYPYLYAMTSILDPKISERNMFSAFIKSSAHWNSFVAGR